MRMVYINTCAAGKIAGSIQLMIFYSDFALEHWLCGL